MATDLYNLIMKDPQAYGMEFGRGQSGVGGEVSRVDSIFKTLEQLKTQVKAGQLTLGEFQDVAQPLTQVARQATDRAVANKGQAAITPAWSQLLNNGYVADRNGKTEFALPFSKTDYAKLPDNVLPTQGDINKGLFDPNLAPLQRTRMVDTSAPAQNPGPNGSASPIGQSGKTPINQTGSSPVFTANPDNPSPYGGLGNDGSQASIDAQKIAQEGALQQQLSAQSQNDITSKRSKYLNDLTGLVNQNTNKQMSLATPGILEDLNSRGLLRSTGTGEALANKAQSLNADASNQLAQYGIQGETQDLGNYSTMQNNYNQSRDSALSRQFSVEDYQNQVRTGQQLGADYAKLTPTAPSAGKQNTNAAITAGSGLAGAYLGGPAAGKAAGSAANSATQK